jgi:branched-chain amino acid transport system permease protein
MEYLIHLATLFSIFAILAVSLDLVVGYTGLLSLTHAAFYGIGAYAVALLVTNVGINFFLALIIGIFFTAIVALFIGIVLSRFRGDYYSLGCIGFNVIVYSILLNWQTLTNGPLGITGITRPSLFGLSFVDNIAFFILSFLFLCATYSISYFFVDRSSFGRVLNAIREDEEAVSIFGYNTLVFKLVVFVFAAAMAAVAGGLYATYITFIDPNTFIASSSIFVLSAIILGGLGSLRGAVLGAFILTLLPEALRFVGFPADIAAQLRQLIYGVILIALMLYRSRGLIGVYKL